MVVRKKRNEPDIYICERCHKEITDRWPRRFKPIKYCAKCLKERERIKNHKKYRKLHPPKPTKQQIIIKTLKKNPATSNELIETSKIKNRKTLYSTVAQLRNKGHNIKMVYSVATHYVLVN